MTFNEAFICNHMQTEVCANRTKPRSISTTHKETVTDALPNPAND